MAGGVQANRVARWDGSTWSRVGSGMDTLVRALAVFDGGDGPALLAGGSFRSAGGLTALNVAAWEGTSWTPLGKGLDYWVVSLTVFDDGSGPPVASRRQAGSR